MRSSTSNSDSERLTAADRPGVAQPVPERPVPPHAWPMLAGVVALLVVAATAAWEWRMRGIGLEPGDFSDGPSSWVEQRRRVDAGDVEVAIIGDSRILFGTDLDRFEALTGVRPVQLALVGSSARFLLDHVAADPDFRGLLIVGIAETNYYRPDIGRGAAALERYRYESPAQWSSHQIEVLLSRWLAFLDDSYRLSRLVQRLDPGWRAGTRGPYDAVWKLATTRVDRDTRMWSRIEQPGLLQEHARATWMRMPPPPPLEEALILETQQRTRDAVAAIRARGGEVVFVRPPSRGPLRELQHARLPRERGWDPLLDVAGVVGVHSDDVPAMQRLEIPEYSHVSAACATVYTDAYVRALAERTPRLGLHPAAPPALTPADCAPSAARSSVLAAPVP